VGEFSDAAQRQQVGIFILFFYFIIFAYDLDS
jgi:hypothetical protein